MNWRRLKGNISDILQLYWQRADLKWHSYEPAAAVSSIEAFCEVVDKDLYGCFWG